MTIHHATLAKAAKLGVVMTQENELIVAHWTEKNKRAYAIAGSAPAILDDMRVWRMLVREYSQLKVEQPHVKDGNYVWEISLRGDVIGEGARLDDAFEDALAVLSPKKAAKADRDEGDDDVGAESEGDEDTEGDEGAAGEPGDDDETEEEGGKSVVKKRYKTKYRPFKATCGDEITQLMARSIKVKDEDTNKMVVDLAKLKKLAKLNDAWSDSYATLNPGMQRLNVGNRIRAMARKGTEIHWL